MKDIDREIYPVLIFEDRYSGAYSNGKWIAMANAQIGANQVEAIFEGIHSDDLGAMEFWNDVRTLKGIAVGNTPNEALKNLRSNFE